MNGLLLNSVSKTVKVFRGASSLNFQRCSISTDVGDKIPINFMKDGKDPVILANSEYPEFVLRLHEPLPTKNQLLKMIENAGGMEGDLIVLGIRNIKRAKRLMGLDLVRENNILASSSK